MFFPEGNIRVYLYGEPVDMRKSYDGLYALARNGMQGDPLSGHLFCLRQPTSHANKDFVFRPQRLVCLGKTFGGWKFHQRLARGAHTRDGLDGFEAHARRHRAQANQAPEALCARDQSG